MDTLEGDKLIAEFMELYRIDNKYPFQQPNNERMVFGNGQYHLSWDWLHPVYRKVIEIIGIWMITNGHDKLWLEKSKEIERAMLNEETPQKSALLISWLIQWYNQQSPQNH